MDLWGSKMEGVLPANHLDAHLGDAVVGGVLEADVLQDLDDPLPHRHARVQDARRDRLVVLVDQLLVVQDEPPHEVDRGLPDHGGGVGERVVDPVLE